MGSNSKTCMNASCGATTTLEWKKGWPLRSGGFADLCYRCGTAYESSFYCETFHSEQSGWRECYICCKRLHCGCIASKFHIEFLDLGGVGCTACADRYQPKLIKRNEDSDEIDPVAAKTAVDKHATNGQSRNFGSNIHAGRLSQLCQIVDDNKLDLFSQSERSGTKAPQGEKKQEEVISNAEIAKFPKPESKRRMLDIIHTQESLSQPSLSMNFGVIQSVPPFSRGSIEGIASPAQKMGRTFPIFPKPSASSVASVGRNLTSQMRMARPPVEGRGKNHLLPRYWPRTTDQELEQIAGNLNSKVVPLFEKILSASDAGRIGRLVLPKACAEAYFPSINSSEGIPLRVQDVKGKEWTFQFRFWPNNNSRMYVLEGVTPCIQSMQLQAGDTVTFSQIDPGGKLIMGFRKATKLEEQQGSQKPTLSNGVPAGETSSSVHTKNPLTINGCSGLLRMVKGGKDSPVNDLSGKLESAGGYIGLLKNEIAGGRMSEDQPRIKEKKRTRNVLHKSKRMLINNEEAAELRFSLEEAQDLLRPPPGAKPTIVTIEGHEFEEYDEPPVFAKRTIFTSRPSGEQEQWAQCDDCSKWRRLPADALLSSKWTCSENVWDAGRCSCSVAEETNPFVLEDLLKIGTGSDSRKRRITETQIPDEPCGLDALASAAVLGESLLEESSAGATTRHPRHRPGCTCIVCIQPPSGKGKHKPTCTCTVCTTVKRRFKTQMLRRKKRQMDREAEANRRYKDAHPTVETDMTEENGITDHHKTWSGNAGRVQGDLGETSNAGIDLNFYPNREEMQQVVEDAKKMVSPANNGHRQEEDHCLDEGLVVPEEGKAEKGNEGRRDTASDTILAR